MTALIGIFMREYLAFWRTSTGWVVAALFTLMTGLVLSVTTLGPGEVATMRAVVGAAHWILLIAAPAISMRLVADEARAGTLETLMTTPASDWAIATGKFVAALAVVATVLGATLPSLFVLRLLTPIEAGPIITGYLGVLLAAGLYLAVGLVCSAFTRSQVTAFLTTLTVMALWNAAPVLAPGVGAQWLTDAAGHIAIADRLTDFARGVINTADAVFFLTTWFVGIAGTVAALGWRRWA